MILAGDIGGTKTHLALFEGVERVADATFASREHPGLEAIARRFLEANGSPRVGDACFGIAGPIQNQRVVATNLPWVIDGPSLAQAIGARSAVLINDLEANAYGIDSLAEGDLATLNPGAPGAAGTQAVISAGTGLGEAGLLWDGVRHQPFPSEGGHADFAPRNELEDELLLWLRRELGDRVSWERILSGPGLYNVYRFLRDTGRWEEPLWLREELRAGDFAAVISRAGLEGRSALCTHALDLFVSIYGAEAGNLALKLLATGGVFVGGGIAPKNLAKLREGSFIAAFLDKGRLRPLLEAIPVKVILNPDTALLGAAERARRSATRG